MATAIQILGAVLIVTGIALLSVPVSIIVAGLAAVFFGIALERS
jgi:hypothetical protein